MPSIPRRRYLSYAGSVSLGTAGCIGVTTHESVHLHLVNRRETTHVVTVTDRDGDFQQEVEVAANDGETSPRSDAVIIREDFLDSGSYDLELSDDTGVYVEPISRWGVVRNENYTFVSNPPSHLS